MLGGMKLRPSGSPSFSVAQRADWLARFRSSGLTLGQFAARHDLKPGRLRYWIYGKSRSSRPVQARDSGKFVEMKMGDFLGPERWEVEIGLPGGVAVRFRAGAALDWLEAVVAAVRRAC